MKVLDDTAVLVAIGVGALMQIIHGLGQAKFKLKFIFFVITSSYFTGIYIINPILNYMHMCDREWRTGVYAVGAFISLYIITFLSQTLPDALKTKFYDILGIRKEEDE